MPPPGKFVFDDEAEVRVVSDDVDGEAADCEAGVGGAVRDFPGGEDD